MKKIFDKFPKGINEKIVKKISQIKNEPLWMTCFRLNAYKIFKSKKNPKWGANLSEINFNDIRYYLKPTESVFDSWEKLPKNIKDTYKKLKIPEIEKNFLGGLNAQYESETVYEKVNKNLQKKGIIFCDIDSALKKYPKVFKKYFATLVKIDDNKYAALNSAVWSGGTFLYVPKNIQVELPLQAYFRINSERFGQFERTLIIADEGSKVHYIEGCTAPVYSSASLHAAVVEIFALKNSQVRYTTIQNWSNNIYNLVTKRAIAYEDAVVEWIDCNIGSRVTMKYPCVVLKGDNSKGQVLSLAYAGNKQHHDAGAKIFHIGKNTKSRIVSKSVSKNKGRTSFRGLVLVKKGAINSTSYVSCNALMMDEKSRSDTYPTVSIKEKQSVSQHEATVEKLGERKLFYMTSRGIKKEQAESLLVNSFIEPVTKELPIEYSVELYRLVNLEMSGAVG
jgi:Fe-S cluster assembly protein SufB